MFAALLGYVILGGIIYYGVKGAWELLKFACNAVVWVVNTIFTAVGALVDYLTETMETSPDHEPNSVYITNANPLLEFIEDQEAKGKVHSDDEVLEIKRKLKDATQNGETILLSKVVDAEGKEGIANPKFVKAEKGYESQIQDALKRGQIYEKRIKVA